MTGTDPIIASLLSQFGAESVLTDPASLEAYAVDWSRASPCVPPAALRPASVPELQSMLGECVAKRQPLVIQGGRTGVCGGATPQAGELVLSLERMRRVLEIDVDGRYLVAEAGATLQAVQEAAAAQDLLFPLDLGARGTCTIGGNIATNAGGNRVIRYGTCRELVLSIEAVLPNGQILPARQRILKDTTGYDLKQLLIGAEGTTGVITSAVLKLSTRPSTWNAALLGVRDFDGVQQILAEARRTLVGGPSAFEVLWNDCWNASVAARGVPAPLGPAHDYYVLLEHEGQQESADRAAFQELLERLVDSGAVADATLAQSERERQLFWALRDSVADILTGMRAPLTFDVGLRIADTPAFVAEVRDRLHALDPRILMVCLGHLGDGTVHLLVDVRDAQALKAVSHAVYGALPAGTGSVSTEHGIGVAKRMYLSQSRTDAEIALMRSLRQSIDPHGILNRARVLP